MAGHSCRLFSSIVEGGCNQYMTIPFGEVPEAERDEQIGFWWKDRLELLVDENRPKDCLLYTSPSPRDLSTSRMPSSA